MSLPDKPEGEGVRQDTARTRSRGPIPFRPADVDVTDEPAYQAIVGSVGPTSKVPWVLDDKTRIAKQTEMLQIDIEASERWIVTMRDLIALDLPDAEFTAERMLRLKKWEAERKRLQHNLHYKYNGHKRRPRLIEKDVDKQLAAVRKKLDSLTGRHASTAAGATAESLRSTLAPLAAPRDVREPASILATMTGIENPYNETSATLHQALRRAGVDLTMAKQLVDQITSTWHPGAAAEFAARRVG